MLAYQAKLVEMKNRISELIAKGQHQEAELLKQRFLTMVAFFSRLRKEANDKIQAQKLAGIPEMSDTNAASSSSSGVSSLAPPASTFQAPALNSNQNQLQSTQANQGGIAQVVSQRSLNPGSTNFLPNRPDIALQMQKLLEQHKVSPRPSNSHFPQADVTKPTLQPVSNPPTAISIESDKWQGSLTWSGFDSMTGNRREVMAEVFAQSPRKTDM